ncbi:hypothetical protein BZA70DRAFT_278375 [Myxozyma melibiosi]|uniref:DUF155 domain-containing protein n=1 Tax=Myxozyma melibiosi TaxID=54550 RepID=A0ABR1F6S7_9ASCO
MLQRIALGASLRCGRFAAASCSRVSFGARRSQDFTSIWQPTMLSLRSGYHASAMRRQVAETEVKSTTAGSDNPPTSRMPRTTTKQSLRRIAPSRILPHSHQALVADKSCVALTVADLYDLPRAIEIFHQMGHLQAEILLPHEAAYCAYPLPNGQKADTFVLSNGSIVTFGMPELSTIQLADELRAAEIRPYAVRESEDMDYVELPLEDGQDEELANGKEKEYYNIKKRSYMYGDVIVICGQDRLLDKVAFASGLARSTKLAVIEESLEKYLESVRDITDRLATGRKLPVHDGREVLKKTGELLALRGNLNLYSELTETPDLYWSEPELETIYRVISKNLDIAPRIAILNKKLDYVSEVVSILKAHLSEEKGVRLEWMIIVLIMVEVCFETVHFVARYVEFPSKEEDSEVKKSVVQE